MTTQTNVTAQNPKKDIFQIVTDQITEALERGVEGKWKCPWDKMTQVATNASTGRRLVGISQLMCHFSMVEKGFTANRWMTMNQANKLGGKVIKGSKSTMVFWLRPFIEVMVNGKPKLISPEGDQLQKAMEEGKAIWSYRNAPYFNVAQIEGLEETLYQPLGKQSNLGLGDDFSPIAEADAFIDLLCKSKDPLKLIDGDDRAYYSPSLDHVAMPDRAKFHDEVSYYSTVFHEVSHFTGAKGRLNRPGIVDVDAEFGTAKYAMEELVAELSATFKSAELGLEHTIREDHVQYIASWIKLLKSDTKAIFKASQEAMKAVNFINNLAECQLGSFKSDAA